MIPALYYLLWCLFTDLCRERARSGCGLRDVTGGSPGNVGKLHQSPPDHAKPIGQDRREGHLYEQVRVPINKMIGNVY